MALAWRATKAGTSWGYDAMERTQYLRAQAALLRGVAGTFDMQSIRDRLLALAQECEQLATLVQKELEQEPKK